ncbi:MAG: CotH kinase family protein [Bacteroidota bacterium]
MPKTQIQLFKLFLLLSCFFSHFLLSAQTLTQSTLPIISINTNGQEIRDEPKILAQMGIIFNGKGQINRSTELPNHFDGNIGIELRGNSTQGFEKTTYSLEIRNAANQDSSVKLLGMGKEEDWILHAMVIDKTQLRIPMSFRLFRLMGHYAADWRYVELIVNGEYRGLYLLTERIKRDKNRVDIAKLQEDDIEGDELSGGYILRIDWIDDYDAGFFSRFLSQGKEPMFYQWYYPRARDIQPEQAAYIQDYIDQFEEAVFAERFVNSQGKRYTEYIDQKSFIDFLLINEFSKNSDGYKLSSYLHKEKESRGGRLRAGPIWDFDQTYGLSRVCSNDDYTGWTYLQNQPGCEDLESMPMWWQAMIQDSLFANELKNRWFQLREWVLHTDSVHNWIDRTVKQIEQPIEGNFALWDYFIGGEIWYEPQPVPQSYAEEISYLKNWTYNRLLWMDQNIGQIRQVEKDEKESPLQFVFPNLSAGRFTILGNPGQTLTVFGTDGRTVYQARLDTHTLEISLSHLASGIYYIALSGGLKLPAQKIVLQP